MTHATSPSRITLSLREALAIQSRQLTHYAAMFPEREQELRDHFKSITKISDADDLDAKLSIHEINERVPRGGSIESFLGLK